MRVIIKQKFQKKGEKRETLVVTVRARLNESTQGARGIVYRHYRCRSLEKDEKKKRKEKRQEPNEMNQVSSPGDQVLEKAEEIPLFLRTAGTCNLRSRCHSHWADNILIPHVGELVVVMQTGDADLLAGVHIRLGERKSNTIYSTKLVTHGLVLRCPLAVD
jgi:hypothetical protein